MKNSILKLYLISFLLVVAIKSFAQQFPCGTLAPDSIEAARLAEILEQNMSNRTIEEQTDSVYYVPLRIHIIRHSNGETAIPESRALAHLTAVNKHFIGAGLQFYMTADFNYIDSDDFYIYKYAENWTFLTEHKEEGLMNIIYAHSIDTDFDGFAGFPPHAYVVVRGTIDEPSVLIHELGHTFFLQHTHAGNEFDPSTHELVDGSNCEITADQICDTPADPYGLEGAEGSCINGYSGTAVDLNGDLYSPPFDNFMAYWICDYNKKRFTLQQLQRIRLVYENYYGSSGLYPFNNTQMTVASPSALTISFQEEVSKPSFVQLNWQDNSTNEVSFLIERSTDPDKGFYSIGFNEKNATTFVDNSVQQNQTYYYRIRPSNSKDAFSNVVSLQTPSFYCVPSAEPCSTHGKIISSFSISKGNSTVLNGNPLNCASYSLMHYLDRELFVESSYNLSLTLENNYELFSTAWIDFNRNKAFEEDEVIYTSNSATNIHSSVFAIPSYVENGIYRLRIRAESGKNDANTSCISGYLFGEVRDIEFNITGQVLGTEDEMLTDISVYPNPARNQLNINLSENNSLEKIEIFNIQGIKIAEKNSTNEKTVSFSIQSLATGFYIVKISTSKQILSKRIAIQ